MATKGEWSMPEMSEKDASEKEPNLIRLCNKYKFKDEFGGLVMSV
jgi:hypothetical protein